MEVRRQNVVLMKIYQLSSTVKLRFHYSLSQNKEDISEKLMKYSCDFELFCANSNNSLKSSSDITSCTAKLHFEEDGCLEHLAFPGFY